MFRIFGNRTPPYRTAHPPSIRLRNVCMHTHRYGTQYCCIIKLYCRFCSHRQIESISFSHDFFFCFVRLIIVTSPLHHSCNYILSLCRFSTQRFPSTLILRWVLSVSRRAPIRTLICWFAVSLRCWFAFIFCTTPPPLPLPRLLPPEKKNGESFSNLLKKCLRIVELITILCDFFFPSIKSRVCHLPSLFLKWLFICALPLSNECFEKRATMFVLLLFCLFYGFHKRTNHFGRWLTTNSVSLSCRISSNFVTFLHTFLVSIRADHVLRSDSVVCRRFWVCILGSIIKYKTNYLSGQGQFLQKKYKIVSHELEQQLLTIRAF